MSPALRSSLAGLFLAAASCSSPPFDIEAGPDAFWSSCMDGGGERTGSVRVEEAADLGALSGITLVMGDLVITELAGGDLGPLQQLRCVRGLVQIEGNPGLRSLDGLQSLVAVEDGLELTDNPALERIDALSALRFVRPFSVSAGRGVTIARNPALTSLAGPGSLQRIGGHLHVRSNEALVDLGGLEGLEHVADDLVVSDNPALLTTAGLEQLGTVSRIVVVEGNGALVTLGLPGLVEIGGDAPPGTIFEQGLDVENNAALERIEMPLVETIETMLIQDNPALAAIDMRSLRRVAAASSRGGDVTILGPLLAGMDLRRLEEVTGDFEIGGPSLRAVSAPSLASVGGAVQIGEEVVFEPSTAPTIDALDLSSLDRVGDRVSVHNTALADLSGLRSLGEVGSVLDIRANGRLASLDDLSLLTSVRSLVVATNAALPTCQATALEQRLVVAGFTGSVRIEDNDDAGSCP